MAKGSDKTRLIEFGRHAADNRKQRGEGGGTTGRQAVATARQALLGLGAVRAS